MTAESPARLPMTPPPRLDEPGPLPWLLLFGVSLLLLSACVERAEPEPSPPGADEGTVSLHVSGD